jgi:hypothetical protein
VLLSIKDQKLKDMGCEISNTDIKVKYSIAIKTISIFASGKNSSKPV